MDAPGIRDQRGLVCCHELPVTVGVAYPGGANPNVHTKNPTRALIVAASALIWLAGSLLFQWAAPQTGFMPGIDIIYPPAGLRTLLLIVGGGWAAAGLSIANLAMIPDALGLDSLASRLLFAAYTGVAPYVAMIGSFRMLGIARSLRNLSPRHLPVLCFGIALGSSVLHVGGVLRDRQHSVAGLLHRGGGDDAGRLHGLPHRHPAGAWRHQDGPDAAGGIGRSAGGKPAVAREARQFLRHLLEGLLGAGREQQKLCPPILGIGDALDPARLFQLGQALIDGGRRAEARLGNDIGRARLHTFGDARANELQDLTRR